MPPDHVEDQDISELEDKVEGLEPDDFENLADEQSFTLPHDQFSSLAGEPEGSEVLLIVKGVIGRKYGTAVEAGPPSKRPPEPIRVNIRHAFLVHGKVLTTKARKGLKTSQFALPGRRYPLNDISHARNALARVSQFGSISEKMRVRSAVRRKFPTIAVSKEEGK